MKRQLTILAIFLTLFPCASYGQFAEPGDCVYDSERFAWQQLIVPGALFAVGVTGVLSPWYVDNINKPVQNAVQGWNVGQRLHFDDYAQFLPVAGFLGIGFAEESQHSFAERACMAASAGASMGIMVYGIKMSGPEKRPDSDAMNSFPSGHTAMAFMGAELVRREYGGWWGAGAYLAAGTVAFMRIYNNRHWTNDILAGAGFGILCADAAFWLLPLERRLFGLERSDSSLAVLPAGCGLSLSCVF